MKEMSGDRIAREMNRVGINQNALCALAGVAPSIMSLWRNNLRKPSAKVTQKVARTLSLLERLVELHQGVSLNMNDVGWVRRALREMGRGKPPAKIDQGLCGRKVINDWAKHAELTPHEVVVMAQLRSGVAEADVVSLPCQRWLRAWLASFDEVLAGKKFSAFAADHVSREAAITALANAAFAVLLRSAGKGKVVEYMRGLLITRELAKSPTDDFEN